MSAAAYGSAVFVPLGRTQQDYDFMLAESRRRGDDGVEVSNDPGWHCHPALGITGHLHPRSTDPHTHRPEVGWDTTNPIPLSPLSVDGPTEGATHSEDPSSPQ